MIGCIHKKYNYPKALTTAFGRCMHKNSKDNWTIILKAGTLKAAFINDWLHSQKYNYPKALTTAFGGCMHKLSKDNWTIILKVSTFKTAFINDWLHSQKIQLSFLNWGFQ